MADDDVYMTIMPSYACIALCHVFVVTMASPGPRASPWPASRAARGGEFRVVRLRAQDEDMHKFALLPSSHMQMPVHPARCHHGKRLFPAILDGPGP